MSPAAAYTRRMVTPPCSSLAARLDPPAATSVRTVPARLLALGALAKPRLAAFSVATTLVAYLTARPAAPGLDLLLLLTGTAAAAAGALSLNQWRERECDAQMRRTRGRPLPAGALTPAAALIFSLACSVTGVSVLGLALNPATAILAALTIVIYGLIYTPLKRRTRWATEVGSVSGALPALMGNAAVGDLLAVPGLTLTAILLCWQMPHFFALGWRCRDDYRAAGFPLLPAIDPTGARTAAWSLGYVAVLLPLSLVPWALGGLGAVYGGCAALVGLDFLGRAWRFRRDAADRDHAAARLFAGSLLHLPLVMIALVVDRLGPW